MALPTDRTDPTVETLRRRADGLRRLAAELECTSVTTLHRHAGDDTWRGARPRACVELLRVHQARLDASVADLRWQARRLERRADELAAVDALHGMRLR